MAITFKLYSDSGLTTEFDTGAGDKLTAESDGLSHDFVLYFGSTATSKKVQATSNPGVDQITLTPADSNPGADHETTEIKLAITSGGLATATAGAALSIGVTVNSGVANAVPIYVRLTDATAGVASTELSITSNNMDETSA